MGQGNWTEDDAGEVSGAGDYWKANEHVGELTMFVGVRPTEVPVFGKPDETETVVLADAVVVLSGDDDEAIYSESTIWGVMGRQMAKKAPHPFIVGTLTLGTKKPGQSAPFILEPADGEAMRKALGFLNEHSETKDGMPNFDHLDEAAF